MKKLTRAERYKRNYRLIQNTYQDSKLSKKAQTWSDDRIYKELGIKVANKKTPELKKVKKERKTYYARKYNKYREARLKGLSPERSIKVRSKGYNKKVIGNYVEYEKALKRDISDSETERRVKIWEKMSKNEGMIRDEKGKYTGRDNIRDKLNLPPEIVERAIQHNREAYHIVNGKKVSMGFDDYDKYGFALEYYTFIYGSETKARQIVRPTPYGVETYRDTRKVIA